MRLLASYTKVIVVCGLSLILSGCGSGSGCEKKVEFICDENGCRFVGTITCPKPSPPTPTPLPPWPSSLSFSASSGQGFAFTTCSGWY